MQAWDRYAGMNNNPVKYNDPSGHIPECGPDGIYCDRTVSAEEKYNIKFKGNWDDRDKDAAISAVEAVARMLGAVINHNAGIAWNLTYNYIIFTMGSCDLCDPNSDVAGYTYGSHDIRFSGLSDQSDLKRRNHVVHELGHAFKALVHFKSGIDVYSELQRWRKNHSGYPDRPEYDSSTGSYGPNSGFASPQNVFTWQQSNSGDDSNEFADQFLGWGFNRLGEIGVTGGLAKMP